MTTTALPTDPTQLPCGPDKVEIAALHLSINQTWESGSSHNIHLVENGDIGVILQAGRERHGGHLPHTNVDGHVVVALNVDGDHDEVHFSGLSAPGAEKTITQAIEALVSCRNALMRVRKS